MNRKSELLRATERRLFWVETLELFEGWLASIVWCQLERQNRKTAKQLAKRGLL